MKQIGDFSNVSKVALRVSTGNADTNRYGRFRQGSEQGFVRGVISDGENEIIMIFRQPLDNGAPFVGARMADLHHLATLEYLQIGFGGEI